MLAKNAQGCFGVKGVVGVATEAGGASGGGPSSSEINNSNNSNSNKLGTERLAAWSQPSTSIATTTTTTTSIATDNVAAAAGTAGTAVNLSKLKNALKNTAPGATVREKEEGELQGKEGVQGQLLQRVFMSLRFFLCVQV
jgi:hypothetical protein